jgi:outer membrane protein OmpA-like peptidoglycan-associated protein
MRGGLVVFMTLAQGASAQVDPPPGAALDPPPGPAGSSPTNEAPPAATEEAPDWGDEAAGTEDELDMVPASEPVDTGTTEDDDFDARSESLAESSSLQGATGLMRVLSATSGAPGTFRFSLLTGFYSGTGFLCPQCPDSNGEGTDTRDEVDRVSANLFLSATPASFLEAYLGIFSHSTSTNRPAPQLKQVVGDWNIGAKVFTPSDPDQIFALGAALDLGFSTGSGQVGISGIDSINLGLKALGTADFSRAQDAMPLRAHVNVGYQFDNSGKLVEDYERDNGPIDRIERFSLDINRVDFLTFGLGVEGLFDAARPFVEWSIDIPANRQSYLCLRNEARSGDSCLRDSPNFSTTPSRLTAGVRVMPWKAVPWWLEGMTLTGSLDVATGGASAFLVEVAPEVPWSVWFGLSYAVDTRPRVKVEHVAIASPVEQPELTVHGLVVEKATSNAIPDAEVRFDGRDLTGMIATAQGTFVTASLEPGRYTFRVRAPGFKETTCSVDVNAAPSPADPAAPAALSVSDTRGQAAPPGAAEAPPGVSSVTCELEPVPKVSNINGRVSDLTTGEPIGAASVRITDVLGRELELQVDQVGAFRFENVPPGTAIISVQGEGYLTSVTRMDVEPLQELDQRFVLAPIPAKPSIRIAGQKLELRSPVVFQPGSPKLTRDAMFTIQELAPFLEQHPEIGRLEIQVHTADTDAAANALSTDRANTVRDALVLHGVPAARLTARGMGGSDPAKPAEANDRVVFLIELATALPAPASTPVTPATSAPAPAPAPSGLPAPAPMPPPAPMPKLAPPPNL